VALGLRKDAKVELLSTVPLSAGLSKRQLARLASIADQLEVRQGKVLIREGALGQEFFILLDGKVEVSRKGKKLATRGKGDFFGEIALVSDVPRVATVTAVSPLRVLVIRDREFRELLEDTPAVAIKVLKALAKRVPTAQF
jgi:CRP-like cAMP-binding protein